jgi:hypothetical protein
MSNHEHPCKWCGKDMRYSVTEPNHESQCPENPSRPTPEELIPTCPCQFCDKPTTMTSTRMCDNCVAVHDRIRTRMCDNCVAVHDRIRTMPIKVLNKIVKSARSKR